MLLPVATMAHAHSPVALMLLHVISMLLPVAMMALAPSPAALMQRRVTSMRLPVVMMALAPSPAALMQRRVTSMRQLVAMMVHAYFQAVHATMQMFAQSMISFRPIVSAQEHLPMLIMTVHATPTMVAQALKSEVLATTAMLVL
jgi:hypothetical protein